MRAILTPALLAVLFAAAPARAQDGRQWTITSPDTLLSGEHAPLGEAGCRFTVLRGETVLWSADQCFGDRTDWRFLSNDGERLLVLVSFPEIGVAAADRAPGRATAGALYRRGRRLASYRVGQFVKNTQSLVKTRRHFYWLEGALRQPGVPPGLTKDGAGVELNTLDHRQYVIGFDGSIRSPKKQKTESVNTRSKQRR